MSAFLKIQKGLREAIAYEKGELKAKTKKISITPLRHYEANEIKNIRIKAGMTQQVFAGYLGVSVKTVEAWEAGKNHPAGSACRLLELANTDPSFPQRMGIINY